MKVGFNIRVEIIILLIVLFFILSGHLFCSCARMTPLEAFQGLMQKGTPGSLTNQILNGGGMTQFTMPTQNGGKLRGPQAAALMEGMTPGGLTGEILNGGGMAQFTTPPRMGGKLRGPQAATLQEGMSPGGLTSEILNGGGMTQFTTPPKMGGKMRGPQAATLQESFTGANTNYGESSLVSTEGPINTSSWFTPNLTYTPGKPVDKAIQNILNRPKQQVPLPNGQMLMFQNTQFSPKCCPNTYSTSMGCACMTVDQYNYLIDRGGNNVPYSEY
jgi:hypothetical protein